MNKQSVWEKYGYIWVTLVFFLLSLAGHWLLAWYAYVQTQDAHQQPIEITEYLVQTGRDTLENWQSEFLQLIWQVLGLSFLLYVGSSQSKEGEERKEEKIDEIFRTIAGRKAEKFITRLERKYPKR